MKQSWTKGLNEEQKRDVRANFKEALVMRKRMREILQNKQDQSLRSRRLKENYESPNWAYLQADSSGYERAIEEILSLIEDEL